jgi:hypothetical protein
MTIHFAAARTTEVSALVKFLTGSVPLNAANDNGAGIGGDKVLKAALRHFAEHGLAAAELACEKAQKAFFAGESYEYQWWMSICAALDKRMAAAVAFRGESQASR